MRNKPRCYEGAHSATLTIRKPAKIVDTQPARNAASSTSGPYVSMKLIYATPRTRAPNSSTQRQMTAHTLAVKLKPSISCQYHSCSMSGTISNPFDT